MVKAGLNLVATLDVVDFGEILFMHSPDNPGLTRIQMTDEVGGGKRVHMDLSNDELLSLIRAAQMYVED